ncbi:hypothetical protein B1R94_02295 [Mycolicibacterium litorale]|nr:hypothetical protein B1R94_02295 [Mycolicibacterium litorale]
MACSCRGGAAAARTGARIVGYDFTPPGGDTPTRFPDKASALVERRKRGGGTIVAVTAGS